MLTGVETAGLVLAVLPLFISAFEHYNDGKESPGTPKAPIQNVS